MSPLARKTWVTAIRWLAVGCLAVPVAAGAVDWYVSSNGTDGTACGAKGHACRSISQALENAADGDTIWVGPGRYGNVGRGRYDQPGDEHPRTGLGVAAGEPGCIVCVTKGVRLYSLAGASVTVIDGSNPPADSATWATVLIYSDGVIIGAPGQGFTITGGNSIGIGIESGLFFFQQRAVTISDNTDVGDAKGFTYEGAFYENTDPECHACVLTARIQWLRNTAIGNRTAGFEIVVNKAYWRGPGSFYLANNRAIGAATGFIVDPGFQRENEYPHWFTAGNVQLVHNVASGGAVGFWTALAGPLLGNTASSNSTAGFMLVSEGAPFQRNAAVGNGGPGLVLSFFNHSQSVAEGIGSYNANSFYGNDRNRPASLTVGLFGSQFGPSAHCGILAVGALSQTMTSTGVPLPTTSRIPATGNYWGSTTGPSASGSGDAAGGPCDQYGSTTLTAPFATANTGIVSLP